MQVKLEMKFWGCLLLLKKDLSLHLLPKRGNRLEEGPFSRCFLPVNGSMYVCLQHVVHLGC